MTTYKIVRHYQDPNLDRETVERGLTLEEVQAHCMDLETSSRTGTGRVARARTAEFGAWFDGWTEE